MVVRCALRAGAPVPWPGQRVARSGTRMGVITLVWLSCEARALVCPNAPHCDARGS